MDDPNDDGRDTAAKKKKRFYLVDVEARRLACVLSSCTARRAALKAATLDVCQPIVLVEARKLHVFEGWKLALGEAQRTAYARERGIFHRSHVRKMASATLDAPLDPRRDEDLDAVVRAYEALG